jgi:hypothetical protein
MRRLDGFDDMRLAMRGFQSLRIAISESGASD